MAEKIQIESQKSIKYTSEKEQLTKTTDQAEKITEQTPIKESKSTLNSTNETASTFEKPIKQKRIKKPCFVGFLIFTKVLSFICSLSLIGQAVTKIVQLILLKEVFGFQVFKNYFIVIVNMVYACLLLFSSIQKPTSGCKQTFKKHFEFVCSPTKVACFTLYLSISSAPIELYKNDPYIITESVFVTINVVLSALIFVFAITELFGRNTLKLHFGIDVKGI